MSFCDWNVRYSSALDKSDGESDDSGDKQTPLKKTKSQLKASSLSASDCESQPQSSESEDEQDGLPERDSQKGGDIKHEKKGSGLAPTENTTRVDSGDAQAAAKGKKRRMCLDSDDED
eukprot:scaffold16413_cov49-Prasinocladus_malaysianus.AAC.1